MDLQIDRQDSDGTPVLVLRGAVDLEAGAVLRQALMEAIDASPGRPVVVDLEAVDFIDSSGLGLLVGGMTRARRSEGGDLVLVVTGRSVLRVLELTGLTRAFTIHTTREAAVGADG